MEEVSAVISSLEKKVKELLRSYSELQNRNEKLEAELNKLRETIDNQNESIKNLEERNKIIKLAKSLSDSKPDTAAMKIRINEIVREIDKCIAQMNS